MSIAIHYIRNNIFDIRKLMLFPITSFFFILSMRKSLFLVLLFIFIVSSCAEQRSEEQQFQEVTTSPKEVIADKEPFKQYTQNEDGDYVFICSEEQQSRVNTFGGNVHTVWSATSEDGITWTEEQYIQAGSVPEVILFNDKYYMFVMGSCLMYVSEDGVTFEPYSYTLKNENIPEDFRNFGGVDPTAIVVQGKIRLFFYEPDFQGTTPTDPASLAGEHSIVQYTSEDAITWTRIGEAVAVEQITDPDVVLYKDVYYLFLSKGTSVIATSSEDGKTFSVLNNGATVHSLGGVPDTIVMDDELYMYAHAYGGSASNINVLKSVDAMSWEKVGTAVEGGEAPSIVQSSDGTYKMYYVKGLTETEYEELTE